MNKFFIGVGAIIVIGLLLVAIMFGFIPGLELLGAEEPGLSGGSNNVCDYSERDIYAAVCGMAGKTFNYLEFQAYSDSLDFRLCGVDGYTTVNTINDFKTSYASQGMNLELEQAVGSGSWSGTLCLWSKQGVIYGITAGEGAGVSAVFNRDVMYLTGKGTMTEWQQFLAWATT